MEWRKLKDKNRLEKFLYNGGGSRWDGVAIDNEGAWVPFRIGGPKPKPSIIRVDKFKLLAFSRKDAKEKVRLLEETYNGALRVKGGIL